MVRQGKKRGTLWDVAQNNSSHEHAQQGRKVQVAGDSAADVRTGPEQEQGPAFTGRQHDLAQQQIQSCRHEVID